MEKNTGFSEKELLGHVHPTRSRQQWLKQKNSLSRHSEGRLFRRAKNRRHSPEVGKGCHERSAEGYIYEASRGDKSAC